MTAAVQIWMVMGMAKNCDNCINSGRPSYEYPCTVCETAYGSAPSKWEGASIPVNMVEIPCKIGDFVWAIRNFKGKKHPQRGIVSDMYFANDMSLVIVVKHIARGKWGETVFATDKEAYAAIGERKDNG